MRSSGLALVVALAGSASCTSSSAKAPLTTVGPAVALWDGGMVTEGELDEEAARLPPQLKEQVDTPAGRTDFVRSVVTKRLLLAEARRRGLDRTPQVVRQVQELERRLAVQALVDEVQREAPRPTEAELRSYFETHGEQFAIPAQSHLARLLLRGDPKDPSLRGRIERLRSRLLRGEAVSKVCAAGEGPERLKGGDVGWVTQATNPEEQAALLLKARGEMSEVIELQNGLSVLVLLERRAAQPARFEEVRAAVESRYEAVRQRKAFDGLVRQLTEVASVEFRKSSTQ